MPGSPVWAWNGIEWKPLGIPPENWMGMNNFNALLNFNGTLLVSAASIPGKDPSLWSLDKNGFTQVNSLGSLSDTPAQYIYRLVKWRGKVIAGFGDGLDMAKFGHLPQKIEKALNYLSTCLTCGDNYNRLKHKNTIFYSFLNKVIRHHLRQSHNQGPGRKSLARYPSPPPSRHPNLADKWLK